MSNLDSLVLEPIEQPLSNTPNMLSNEDRVLCNMTPLQRLYSIDEDTYEELVCVWAYSCLGNKGYTEVYRVGQAGDKGRDVLAYYDRVKGAFDLYQCKQYKSALTYSDLCGEMGKLLIYTFNNTYPIPQNYYILCPKDVSQSFVDLLSKPPFLSKSFHLFSCTGKTHYLCISSAKNKEQNKTFLPFNFQNIGRQLVQYAASANNLPKYHISNK